jgi:CHC2 zinc finger
MLHLADAADSGEHAARRAAAVPLLWIERAAFAYLRHGPRAIGFAELTRDEQRAVLAMATELVVRRPSRRPGADGGGRHDRRFPEVIMIPEAEVDEVRRRTSLRALVEAVTELRREGGQWVGLCPFHAEKTPSFTVYEDQGRYHCFGCGEDGDVFAFIMKTQLLSFPDAVRVLAAAAGVSLSVTGSVPPPDLARFAADRRLSEATLDRFHIRGVVHRRRPALRYPTTVGIDRLKFLDGMKPKYGWATKGGRAHWYGLRSALAALGTAGTTIYILKAR